MAGLAVVVVAGLVAGALILHPFGQHSAAPGAQESPAGLTSQVPASRSPAPGSPAARSSQSLPAAAPEQQAADQLAALLAQSVNDRTSIDAAFDDDTQCGPNLAADAGIFRTAARSRQHLLSQLAAMPMRSALPSQMLADLTGAWQASIQADNDYAAWARDQASGGCNAGDPNNQAALSPDARATNDKAAFAALWNPIASTYNLTQYQADEL